MSWNTHIPKFRRFVLQNFPFIEEDFDALTDYELICKVIEFLNTVITRQNEVVAEVESFETNITNNFHRLEVSFNDLKSFVDNYFDNLDVQEEINNKLEQMVEDGTFEVIIQHILDMQTITVYDTLEDLKSASVINSVVVETMGFYSKGDGGGARYYITDSGTADNIFVHALANSKYATLVNQKEFNILQIGCKRNTSFDNASILSTIFKGGYSNTTIYVPDGVYETTRINYLGDNAVTKGLSLIGIGKPTFKIIHPNKVKTTLGTYNEAYTVSEGIDELDLIGYATVNTITLADHRTFYYIAVSDASRLPASLVEGMVVKGKDSYTEAVISDIDIADPDGDGTARIYLYETSNNHYRFLNFNVSGSSLNEMLVVKQDLGDDALYIRFNDNVVPSYIARNTQLKQLTSGHSVRVEDITITYEGIHFVKVNNIPKDVFTKTTYLASSESFEINSYTDYTAGLFNFNNYENTLIKGIIFDGGNKEIDKYESDTNNWNIIWSGDCLNLTIEDCEFNNSIMAGVQVSYTANTQQSDYHRIAEDIKVINCNFYNNGRGDIEIISGKNISVESCYGNGVLDIETNNNEVLDNINITDVQFKSFTPYSPGASSSSVNINVSNAKFFIVTAQNGITLNLDNVMVYDLQPLKCHINANNCIFDNIGHKGLHGDEFVYMTNSSIYGLFQALPANNNGIGEYHIDNSTIDLSLWHIGTQVLTTLADFNVNSTIIISSTTRKRIRNNNTVMNFNNVTMKNVYFDGVAATSKQTPRGIWKNCKLLANDNTTAIQATENIIYNNIPALDIVGCYIENNIKGSTTSINVYDSILNATTKPSIRGGKDCNCVGIKTNDGTGINWNWLETSQNGYKVGFSDVEFNSAFTSTTLGVKAGSVTPSTTSIVMGSRGYYVGDSDYALCRLYDNSGTIGVKRLSF